MTNVVRIIPALKLPASFRAFYARQPFDMLKPEHYEQWKGVEATFDPRSIIHGY
jgi:hypothetical protein